MQFPPFRLRKHHGKIRTQIFQRSVSFRISAGENRGEKKCYCSNCLRSISFRSLFTDRRCACGISHGSLATRNSSKRNTRQEVKGSTVRGTCDEGSDNDVAEVSAGKSRGDFDDGCTVHTATREGGKPRTSAT